MLGIATEHARSSFVSCAADRMIELAKASDDDDAAAVEFFAIMNTMHHFEPVTQTDACALLCIAAGHAADLTENEHTKETAAELGEKIRQCLISALRCFQSNGIDIKVALASEFTFKAFDV